MKLHNEINDIDQLYGGDIVEEPGIFILFSLNLYTLFQHFISIMCQYHNLCQYLSKTMRDYSCPLCNVLSELTFFR